MRTSRLAAALVAASVAVLTLVAVWRPILDYDYFWHLATGAWIVEHGAVPRVDPFSYSAPGARWIDLHWLFQLALVGLYELGGHPATRAAGALLGLGVVGVTAAGVWRSDRPAVSGLALGGLAVAAGTRFLVRPDTVSLLLTAIVLALLHRDERRPGRAVWALVPVQLLWANVHGFQAVGLALIGMALAGEAARAIVPGAPPRRDRLGRLAAVLALSTLAALANPNGLEGALLPLRQLGMIGSAAGRGVFGHAIDELRPTLAVLGAGNAAGLLPAFALGALAALAMALDRRRLSVFDVLVCAAFAGLAFAAVRNVALLAVVAAPIFARHANAWLDARPAGARAGVLRVASAATVALLALAAGVTGARALAVAGGPRGASSPALAPFQYPEAAVDWIARERPPGPLYHRLGDGGYLLFRLWPDYPVLIDGRLEVFGEERFAETELRGGGGPETFQRLDERYRFGTALVHFGLFPDLSLLSWLAARPDWRLVHLDDVAAVFVRAAPGAAPRWPAVDVDAALAPLEPTARHPLDLWRRRSRVAVLVALDRREQARALAEESLRRYRDPSLQALLAWLDGAAGR